MEVFKSFLIIIVVVLSFGVAVIAGQNGLLSARCAARCLTEHRDSLRGRSDRNNHRKFKMLDRCKNESECAECMKPCNMSERDIKVQNCDNYCKKNESLCHTSCRFLAYVRSNKAGSCPAMGSEHDEREEWCVHLPLCSMDGDCPDNRKCCPNSCNYACREPDYTGYDVPETPLNLTFEEKRAGKALHLTWILPDDTVTSPAIFVLEARNSTRQKPAWNKKNSKSTWETITHTQSKSVLLRDIHGGHWYQFRVAMVTASGSKGYSLLSKSFISSKGVQKPLPPRNITEGATTLHSGQVDVMIHWEPPEFSDLPIWKYKITYFEMLTNISPVIVHLPVLEIKVPGHQTHCKLKKLEPGKTYKIQIEAVVKHGNRELRSKRAPKYITTYAPPNFRHENQKPVSVYADIIRVEKLEVADDIAYFDKGSLKALLTWSVGEDFMSVVKSFMIYWEPHSCDQDYADLQPYSATSVTATFEVYDLQFECVYNIRVNAVTKKGVQGRPTKIRLRTPVCENILVKGNSLPPECPERVPQIPRSPRHVVPKVITNNCSIDIAVTWKHPRSDLPIHSYLLTYEIMSGLKAQKRDTTDVASVKPRPVEIILDRVNMYVIKGLNFSEIYRIKLYANSTAGLGEPAFIEILTPRILPCGSDKDPEPPDTNSIREKTRDTTTVFTPTKVIKVIPITKATIPPSSSSSSVSTTTITVDTKSATTRNHPPIDIYRTVYYLLVILERLIYDT